MRLGARGLFSGGCIIGGPFYWNFTVYSGAMKGEHGSRNLGEGHTCVCVCGRGGGDIL